jgi:predicted type IV restriction endonuclease
LAVSGVFYGNEFVSKDANKYKKQIYVLFFDKNEFKAASHPKANLRLQLMQQRITQGCSVPPGAGA